MSRLRDPSGGHFFALELEGVEVAHFLQCSGIRSTAKVFEIEEGGVNDFVHKRVGESKWENVTLRAATQVSHALFAWRERCRGGDHAHRMSGAIVVYDVTGEPAERFDFTEVWPVRWKGPDPDSGGSQLAVEELELAHEGVSVR